MRFKPVPAPPATIDGLFEARRAVPLVPGTEGDCCTRLERRLECPPDEARRWLTFLRALGLVERTSRGFVRTRETPSDLPGRFVERVFGAREALDALREAGPLSEAEVFEGVRADVTPWERGKETGWEETWRERTGRVLEWAVLFDLAERTEAGYDA